MWKKLSQEQKIKYREYCDKRFGETIVFVETGEPMYFDAEERPINSDVIIKLLFPIQQNN